MSIGDKPGHEALSVDRAEVSEESAQIIAEAEIYLAVYGFELTGERPQIVGVENLRSVEGEEGFVCDYSLKISDSNWYYEIADTRIVIEELGVLHITRGEDGGFVVTKKAKSVKGLEVIVGEDMQYKGHVDDLLGLNKGKFLALGLPADGVGVGRVLESGIEMVRGLVFEVIGREGGFHTKNLRFMKNEGM